MPRDVITDEDLERYGHEVFDDLYAACWQLIELENVKVIDREGESLGERLRTLEHAMNEVQGFFSVMRFFYDDERDDG